MQTSARDLIPTRFTRRWLGCFAPIWASAILVTTWMAFFATSLMGGRVFAMRDTAHFYFPLFHWCAEEWGAGRIPLWNPYAGLGSPVLAEATSSVLYPGKLIFALPGPFDWWFQMYVAVHCLLAAAGTYWLARSQGRSVAAATLAALSFAFGGSILFQYANVVFLVGAAWLPFAWGLALRILARGSLKDALALAFVLAMMVLGGDPQMVVHVALLAVVWGTIRLFQAKRKSKRLVKSNEKGPRSQAASRLFIINKATLQAWGVLGGAFLLAGLLAAAQIFPSLVWAQATTRATFDRPRTLYEIPVRPQEAVQGILGVPEKETHHERLYEFSIGPWRWLELLVPNLAGRSFPRHQRWMNYIPAEGGVWTPSLYMGLLPLLLAIGQFRFWRGSMLTRWLSWAVVLFGLGSLGWYGIGWLVREISFSCFGWDTTEWSLGQPVGGVYWFLVTCLPGYVQFRYPAKLWTVVALGLACLAARGLDGICNSRTAARLFCVRSTVSRCSRFLGSQTVAQWWGWLSLALGIMTLVIALICVMLPPRNFELPADPYFGPFQSEACGWDLVCGFLQATIVCTIAWWWLQIGRPYASSRGRSGWSNGLAGSWVLVLLTAVDLVLANRWQIVTAPTENWQQAERATTQPIRRKYREALATWSWPEFAGHSSSQRIEEGLRFDVETGFGHLPLLKHEGYARPYGTFLSADYARLMHSIDRELADADSPPMATTARTATEQLSRWGIDRIVRSPAAKSREQQALTTHDVLADQPTLLPLSQAREYRLPEPAPRARSIDAAVACHLLSEEGGRLLVDVKCDLPTTILVNCAFSEGWQATATSFEGASQPLEIRRTEDLICAIDVPAGSHQIEMQYSPAEFRWGVVLSAVGWLLLGVGFGFAMVLARKRRRGRSISTLPY